MAESYWNIHDTANAMISYNKVINSINIFLSGKSSFSNSSMPVADIWKYYEIKTLKQE